MTTFRAKAVDFGYYVSAAPSLVEFAKDLLANTCARDGDWVILAGMKVAGVLRLGPNDAELLDLQGEAQPVLLLYPLCQAA